MHKCCVIIEKILKLEQENTALVIQIEEITTQQVDRDKMLNEFGIAIDARISEWKVLNKFGIICVYRIYVYRIVYRILEKCFYKKYINFVMHEFV